VITVGIDPHKHTHTAAAVNAATGELVDELTVGSDSRGHEELLAWVGEVSGGDGVRFALEDCRHVSGRLERFLVAQGADVVRVPPRLMSETRRTARQFGKSDGIDALAVARAALREPGLPKAVHDIRARELKLLTDHREHLVAERTALCSRLRWHLHDLDHALEPIARGLNRERARRSITQRLARFEQTAQVRICRELVTRIGEITRRETELKAEIRNAVRSYAPQLLDVPGCAELTAAKLVGEVGGYGRFATDAKLARHAGCAPIEASSGIRQRHRLSRQGNRQLNAAFYRIALTQSRIHPDARAYLERKKAEGKSTPEAFRCLKRHLVRTVWHSLRGPAPDLNLSISLT
jgi:transposase